MTWCYVKAHAKKQKNSLNYGEMQLKIKNKIFNLPSSSCHDKVRLGGEDIKNVTRFKYIGSMFDAEGGTTTYIIAKTEFD